MQAGRPLICEKATTNQPKSPLWSNEKDKKATKKATKTKTKTKELDVDKKQKENLSRYQHPSSLIQIQGMAVKLSQ